jgi:hypothetical protein
MASLTFFTAYVTFALFVIYVFMCGNNRFHRYGFIGACYRFLFDTIPAWSTGFTMRFCPARCNGSGKGGCCGPNGPCRYFVITFYALLYLLGILIYVRRVCPYLRHIYPIDFTLHSQLTFFVVPWPWLIIIFLRFYDPGTITRENVNSYLKEYPPDNVLYHPQICPTLKIPVPARSRYCRYSNRRIAFPCFLIHRRYDHYCPWMIATIGERSRRWFLLFLITNGLGAAYYASGCFKLLKWGIGKQPIRWPNRFWSDLRLWCLIALKLDYFVFMMMILLVGVTAALMFFVVQQMWLVAGNVTQLEMDKIAEWKKKQTEAGKSDVYVHAYDRGFLRNWLEMVFPPAIAKHPPVPEVEVAEEGTGAEEAKVAGGAGVVRKGKLRSGMRQ